MKPDKKSPFKPKAMPRKSNGSSGSYTSEKGDHILPQLGQPLKVVKENGWIVKSKDRPLQPSLMEPTLAMELRKLQDMKDSHHKKQM